MNKTLKKNLIAASVGMALAGAVVPAMAGGIATGNILFPYVSAGANAYTFISIVNTGSVLASTDWGYHFSYGMKGVAAPNYTTAGTAANCEHQDGRARTTPADLMQFELRNRIDLPATFGDATSVPYYYTGTTDTHGFLIVNTDHAVASYMGDTTISGEAVVIDTASGMRVAYSSANLSTTDAANPDYTINNVGIAGGPVVAPTQDPFGAAGANATLNVISWYQAPTVTTSWLVAPLGTRSEMTPSGNGGVVASYRLHNLAFDDTGAYDNNEQFHSGSAATPVRCLGVITRTSMLNSGPANNTVNGGWSQLSTLNGDATHAATLAGGTAGAVANKSLVYKIQNTSAIGGSMSFISREAER